MKWWNHILVEYKSVRVELNVLRLWMAFCIVILVVCSELVSEVFCNETLSPRNTKWVYLHSSYRSVPVEQNWFRVDCDWTEVIRIEIPLPFYCIIHEFMLHSVRVYYLRWFYSSNLYFLCFISLYKWNCKDDRNQWKFWHSISKAVEKFSILVLWEK